MPKQSNESENLLEIMNDFDKFKEHPIAKACFREYNGVLTLDARNNVLRIAKKAIEEYIEEYQ